MTDPANAASREARAKIIEPDIVWDPSHPMFAAMDFENRRAIALDKVDRLAALADEAASQPRDDEDERLRVAWWNDMRERGVSQDIAIAKIRAALAHSNPTDGGMA